MVAFLYRPGYAFAGDVTRHLFSVEARASSAQLPGFGIAVMMDPNTGNVRLPNTDDIDEAEPENSATDIWGVVVRSMPMQQASAPGLYGQSPLGVPDTPPHPPQPADILRMGYIGVRVVGTPAPGGQVFVWVAAPEGEHVTGGFEAAATEGSTIAIASPKTTWASGADADGNVELGFNI